VPANANSHFGIKEFEIASLLFCLVELLERYRLRGNKGELALQSEAKRMLGTSLLDRLRCRFIWAGVQTDDGITFRVKLTKDIRDVWQSARAGKKRPRNIGGRSLKC
jgi:hypothetical protein